MSEPVVMRVGDRERGEVDALLRAALSDGVLTLSEYDERAAQCWAARTRPELDEVVRDLPGAAAAGWTRRSAVPVVASPADGPQKVLAVLSESGLDQPLRPGQDVHATAVMGTAEIDLRREDLPHELTVRATAFLGEVKVRVPPGTTVHLSGGAVMGERKSKVRSAPAAGGSVVHVVANAVMGTVVVDDKPRRGGLLAVVRGGTPSVRDQSTQGVRRRLRAVGGALVPLAVAAGVAVGGYQVLSSQDGSAVFGSRVVSVADERGEVGVLFGSTTVVVPDGARVSTSGLTVFGSVSCDTACTGDGDGEVVEVRSRGAFGSVEIVTRTEFEADR